MAASTSIMNTDSLPELPDSPGPKLGPFTNFTKPLHITWIRRLGHGHHATVWEVNINGNEYAVKIFQNSIPADFFWVMRKEHCSRDENRFWQMNNFTIRDMVCHNDPFYSECRAFGRLKETGIEEQVAIKSHGYLLLDLDDRNLNLPPEVLSFQWRRPRSKWEWPALEHNRMRCVVKDVSPAAATEHPNFTRSDFRSMREGIKAINAVGLTNRDLYAHNYLGGKLFDFSIAWTIPHCFVDYLLAKEHDYEEVPMALWYERTVDRVSLDDIVDEFNAAQKRERDKVHERMMPVKGLDERLRAQPGREERREYHGVAGGPDPLRYDWEGAAEERRRVEQHQQQ